MDNPTEKLKKELFKPQDGVYTFPKRVRKPGGVVKSPFGNHLNVKLKPIPNWMHIEPSNATPVNGSMFHSWLAYAALYRETLHSKDKIVDMCKQICFHCLTKKQ